MERDPIGSERRQYTRLDSVFPVLFKVLAADGTGVLSEWIQGFTHNISKGGLLLNVHNLSPKILALLNTPGTLVEVQIRMPLNRPVVTARAKVVWSKHDIEDTNEYFIGINYEHIKSFDQDRIIRYVAAKKMFLPAVIAIMFVLSSAIAINAYLNYRLALGNKALVGQLIKILQESSVAKQTIKDINRDKENLQLKISALEVRINTIEQEKSDYQGKLDKQEIQSNQKIKELNDKIDSLTQAKSQFQGQLIVLEQKENVVTEQLLQLDQKKTVLEKANIDKMYKWLCVHQNTKTGLVMSFEGDKDTDNTAFTYDQSLALQTYANFSDFERAVRVLEFFQKKARRQDGLFFNAYYANDGSVSEYTIHSGPSIWIGIGICQYTKKAQDTKYVYLAEDIANAVIRLQDEEGGIRGGPQTEWYSTEHNLDAYAFFNILYKISGKTKFQEAAARILSWLAKNSYSKTDIPIKRAKGDSTIATDTYSWSIAAVGPEKLTEIGMNPDKIMEFAEQSCAVEVSFTRADSRDVKIKGFDFAAARHLSRGGVISTEWTAQMVIAFRIMADFYRKKGIDSKAKEYEDKADEYLGQLCNMIISSPSPSGQGEGCLPYASADFVDTGHGWTTPRGKGTGSVAATAYTIFAYYRYNPLDLKD